ncbi:MAG: ribosomal protein [Planctomycetota bacterium]|jgi:large subunit ribosomal protein L29
MKVKELREMTGEQLAQQLNEISSGLFRLRVQAETEREDAASEIKKSRRTIARILTVQRERELKK